MLSDAVVPTCTLLEKSTGKLNIYKIPLTEGEAKIDGCRFLSFGEVSSREDNQTILLLGATGAGKSSLINGMINYILGVKWEDPYRFKIVDDGEKTSQAHSQTSLVTVYKLHYREGFNIDYTLTIVDTPGFGDTRGIDRDKETAVQLCNLFSNRDGINVIDAVCFVAQAALARLTAKEKYIFDSIFSIFGKDIKENIRVLVTFADNQKPPVLEAISESGVPCPKDKKGLPAYFKFNNSALFADNGDDSDDEDDEDNIDQIFWKMGMKNMEKFLDELIKMEPKSLVMTNQVLQERKQLEMSIKNLQVNVDLKLNKLNKIAETEQEIIKHENDIRENANFTLMVNKSIPQKVKLSKKRANNCKQCLRTCHFPCDVSKKHDKSKCNAMNKHGRCRVCNGRCSWKVHVCQSFKWIYKNVTATETIQELKDNYEAASGQKMTFEGLMSAQKAEYQTIEKEIRNLIDEAVQCKNKLNEIALNPNHLSTSDYIEMLIHVEESHKNPNWQQKVMSLKEMLKTEKITESVMKGENPLQSLESEMK
uniref:AIG1-type G domain-containing protein n=1 Tax=Cyprinodon variegatus TaxID=28743 RepID=A0A3Q2CNC7_CYPVA